MPIEIVPQKGGPPMLLVDGAWELDAERSWVVTGSLPEIERVQACLPPSCYKRVGGSLLLHFGNCVGHFDVPGLGRLEVRSGKWTERDFDAMLEDVVRRSASLPFTLAESAAMPYERSFTERTDVLYHAFVYLRHALTSRAPTERPLRPALRAVLADPHRQLVRRERRVPLSLAGTVEPGSLSRAVSRGLHRAPSGHDSELARRLRGYLPLDVEESVTHMTFDVPENRFVRGFLDLAVAIVEEVRRKSRDLPPRLMQRLEDQCQEIERVLRPICQHGLWRDVGRPGRVSAESTVLQRRRGYRDVFNHFVLLRMSSRLPMTDRQLERLLEIKDLATLYECWCFLVVVDAVEDVLQERPSRAVLTRIGDWQTAFGRGARISWSNGVEVLYNPSFSRSKRAPWRRSSSLSLRPDIVLKTGRRASITTHVFDAKFKVRKGKASPALAQEGLKSFKAADVHKMHAYRDAIESVRTAWTLYPGDAYRYFEKDRRRVDAAEDLTSLGQGVGVVPLLPGDRVHSSLLSTVQELLSPV